MSTATRSTKSNEPATVDFRQTCDKSATKSTMDFVASVYRALEIKLKDYLYSEQNDIGPLAIQFSSAMHSVSV